MSLKEPILKLLNKQYTNSSLIECSFKNYDLAFKTDQNGNPILLFLGRKTTRGHIKGERYARRMVYDKEGRLIKDHWERKGTAS